MLNNRYANRFFMLLIPLMFLITVEMKPQLSLEEKPPALTLKGDDGGKVSGENWALEDAIGKTQLILYVSPDHQDKVEPLVKHINETVTDTNNTEIVFAVNTDATWIPDYIIKKKIKSKSEENSYITYVLDKNRIIENAWDLDSDTPNIMVLDKHGTLRYHHKGEVNSNVIEEIDKDLFNNKNGDKNEND